jgi:DNA-binding protein H-NS
MTKTYAQLTREIAALQASAQKQLAVEAKGAIAKINDMIAKYGLTAGDLKIASTSAPVPPSASQKTKATKGKRGAKAKGAKFSDGQGNQWGGRGPRPAWLRNAIAAGRTLESFAGGAGPAPAPEQVASVASSPAKKVPAKSIASKRIKSGARSAKAKSKKTSAAAKSSPSAVSVAPVIAAPAGKKVAVKARGGSAVGAVSRQAATSPVKKSPARKDGATKATGVSKSVTRFTGSKTPVAGLKSVVPMKKAAAQNGGPARKKAGPKSAPRKAAVMKNQAPSAPEAATATAAA